jgi:hypothetical protein
MMRLDPMIDDDEPSMTRSSTSSWSRPSSSPSSPRPSRARSPRWTWPASPNSSSPTSRDLGCDHDRPERAQARQAQAAPPGAPETQPGLGPPGQGAEQPTAGPGELPQGLHSALQNLSALRMMNRLSPAEINQSPVANPASTPAERGA